MIGAAIRIARIATGEEDETPAPDAQKSNAGMAGGKARAEKLSPEDRHAIAKSGAAAKAGR